MSLCPITIGSDFDCQDPIQPGLKNFIILINKDDISSYSVSSGVVTNITLFSGKFGYLFQGVRGSFDAEYAEVIQGFFSVGYNHKVQFSIFDISSDYKTNIHKLALNKLVAITFLSNVPGNDNTYFEVYGLGAGLETSELLRQNNVGDFNGVYRCTLETGNEIESLMPYTYFNTDYQTSYDDLINLLQTGTGFPYVFPYILS